MNQEHEHKENDDRRDYRRLPNCCEVSYNLVRLQDNVLGMDWQHGTTENVSETGLCLESSEIKKEVIKHLMENHEYLEMQIQVPWLMRSVRAVGEIFWYKEQRAGYYHLGIKFKSIPEEDLKAFVGSARSEGLLVRLLIGISVGAFLGFLSLRIFQFLAQ